MEEPEARRRETAYGQGTGVPSQRKNTATWNGANPPRAGAWVARLIHALVTRARHSRTARQFSSVRVRRAGTAVVR
jgi:hypothetical protein